MKSKPFGKRDFSGNKSGKSLWDFIGQPVHDQYTGR